MESENILKEVMKEANESPAAASTNNECQDFIKNIMGGKSTMCKKNIPSGQSSAKLPVT